MVFGSCQWGQREEQDRRDHGPGAGTDRGPGPRLRTIRPVKVQDRGTPTFSTWGKRIDPQNGCDPTRAA